MPKRIICILSVFLTLFLANTAQAQSKKELAATDAALAERIARLESRLLTGDPAAERLLQRMDTLEAEQRSLTGEVERLRYERDTLQSELKAINEEMASLLELASRTRLHLDAVDIVAQERKERSRGPSSPAANLPNANPAIQAYGGEASTSVSSVPSAPVLKEVTIPVQEGYLELSNLPASGQNKLHMGDFSGAQRDFQTYLASMPDAPDADEVNFWLGETLFVKGAYADAAGAYIASMRKNSQGAKAADAMVKLGASLRELGNKDEACQTFTSFSSQYPNASIATREKVKTEIARTGC